MILGTAHSASKDLSCWRFAPATLMRARKFAVASICTSRHGTSNMHRSSDSLATDLQHLKLLSIFHYILGGLVGLMSCIPIIHVSLGIMMITAPNQFTGGQGPPPPPAIGWLFALIGSGVMIVGWTLAILMILAGRFLSQRRHYLYCMIVAALACTHTPLGTVLGIFTIFVLVRPSVKELFQTNGNMRLSPEPFDEYVTE